MNIYKYDLISRQISADLVELAKEKGPDNLDIDEVLLTVFTPMSQLDYDSLNSIQLKQKHLWKLYTFFEVKGRRDRFKRYNREAARMAFQEELVSKMVTLEAKANMLKDVKIISDVDENGKVHLNEKLYNVYLNANFNPIQYGTISYGGPFKKQ
ncbi:MAG: hypothetical protein II530_03385 [Bacteroidaceae bacterium]|jgi:hypothetical protein|nr:hypothetical protein [Bacteroidaceae bacterium]